MNQAIPTLEAELCRLLDRQADQYARALDVLRPIPDLLQDRHGIEGPMRQFGQAIDEVAQTSEHLTAVREQWRGFASSPGAALRQAIIRTEQALRELLEHVELTTQRAEQARDALSPRLDELSRLQQMRVAYGAATDNRV